MIDQKFCSSSCMINITPNKVKKNLEKKLQDEKKKIKLNFKKEKNNARKTFSTMLEISINR